MIEFIDRILKNPRLIKLKNIATGEVTKYDIQDYEDDEVIQNGTEINALILNKAFLDMHPVGCIYLTSDITNPGILFGGTWELIAKDRFLVGAGNKYKVNEQGGNETITLKTSNLPAHSHSIPSLTGATNSAGAHSHTGRYAQYGAGGSKLVLRRISGEDDYKGEDTVTNIAGNHNHAVTTNASTTGVTGNSTPINVTPLFFACYIWRRTA